MRRRTRSLAASTASSASALAIAALCAACSPPAEPEPPGWFEDPLQEFPGFISGFGLYDDIGALSVTRADAYRYEPAWPLWSNGAVKTRDLVLPGGGVATATATAIDLPPGATLFKTFSYPLDEGGLRHVETRVMRRTEDGWDYGSYLWDEQGRDARRLDMLRPVDVPATYDGESFDHEVPSKIQCRTCHESNPDALTLGLTPRQLEHAPGGQLDALVSSGALDARPPSSDPIADADAELAWVKGYVYGNCGYCHNGWDGPSSAFDASPEVFVANTVGQPTDGNASAVGTRIVPGDPDASILYQAMVGGSEDSELKPMPPEGVQLRDAEAIARLRAWIESLPPQEEPP
jgi:hypothetical protein